MKHLRIWALAVVLAAAAMMAAAQTVVINGKMVKLPVLMKGSAIYVDAAALAKALGAGVTLDKAKKRLVIVTAGAAQQSVAGTGQLPGGWGEFGKEYTLGEGSSRMNIAVKSAEFTGSRVYVGDRTFYPKAGEKLMVIRYTIHNPQASDMSASWSTFGFTAVDATDQNREYSQWVGAETNSQKLDMYLKPGQKVEAYTYIVVPAAGEIPKLIVLGSGKSVLRFDLRGKVKPLSAPFADPSDTTGSTALAKVPAQMGVWYPTGGFDFRLDSAQFTTGPIRENNPAEGKRYLVLNASIRNKMRSSESLGWSRYGLKLATSEGNAAWNQWLLQSGRDEGLSKYLDPDEETKGRYYFEIYSNETPQTLTVQEAGDCRPLVYDLSGVK